MTNDTLELVCPIDNSDVARFQDIQDIFVHLFDGSAVSGNFGRTFVCGRDPFTTSQDCSSQTSASGSGHKTHILNFFEELQDVNNIGAPEDRSDWYYSLRVNLFSNRSVEQAFLGYTIAF